MIKQIFLNIVIVCIFVSSSLSNNAELTGGYGKIVKFKKNKAITFPAFMLTYIGERKETSKFPNGNTFTFKYYDFKIENTETEKIISWTAGTGDIAPIMFEFDGKKFTIELKYWEKKNKKLGENELVITKF